MKPALLIASGVLLAAFAPALISSPAQAKTMKECAAQWQEMKAVRPDRRHEISRLQQTMHVGRSACRRSSAAAEAGSRFAAARRRTGREAVRRPRRHGGPHARLRRRVEERQGRRQGAGRPEVAAILERVQQAQEGGRDVRPASAPTGREWSFDRLTWPQTRAANERGRR